MQSDLLRLYRKKRSLLAGVEAKVRIAAAQSRKEIELAGIAYHKIKRIEEKLSNVQKLYDAGVQRFDEVLGVFLENLEREKAEDLMNMRIRLNMRQMDNPLQVRELRREIAVIKTVLTQKRAAN